MLSAMGIGTFQERQQRELRALAAGVTNQWAEAAKARGYWQFPTQCLLPGALGPVGSALRHRRLFRVGATGSALLATFLLFAHLGVWALTLLAVAWVAATDARRCTDYLDSVHFEVTGVGWYVVSQREHLLSHISLLPDAQHLLAACRAVDERLGQLLLDHRIAYATRDLLAGSAATKQACRSAEQAEEAARLALLSVLADTIVCLTIATEAQAQLDTYLDPDDNAIAGAADYMIATTQAIAEITQTGQPFTQPVLPGPGREYGAGAGPDTGHGMTE